MQVLPIPSAADQDPKATEVLRAWIIGGQLHVALAAWIWKNEPETWGELLAEAAGHLADAISEETGRDRDAVYATIHRSVLENLDDPDHNSRTGEFVQSPQ
jgi:hypothetical protein